MTPPFNERPPGKVGVGQSHAVESGQKGIFLVKVRKLEILEEFLFALSRFEGAEGEQADSMEPEDPIQGLGPCFENIAH